MDSFVCCHLSRIGNLTPIAENTPYPRPTHTSHFNLFVYLFSATIFILLFTYTLHYVNKPLCLPPGIVLPCVLYFTYYENPPLVLCCPCLVPWSQGNIILCNSNLVYGWYDNKALLMRIKNCNVQWLTKGQWVCDAFLYF